MLTWRSLIAWVTYLTLKPDMLFHLLRLWLESVWLLKVSNVTHKKVLIRYSISYKSTLFSQINMLKREVISIIQLSLNHGNSKFVLISIKMKSKSALSFLTTIKGKSGISWTLLLYLLNWTTMNTGKKPLVNCQQIMTALSCESRRINSR